MTVLWSSTSCDAISSRLRFALQAQAHCDFSLFLRQLHDIAHACDIWLQGRPGRSLGRGYILSTIHAGIMVSYLSERNSHMSWRVACFYLCSIARSYQETLILPIDRNGFKASLAVLGRSLLDSCCQLPYPCLLQAHLVGMVATCEKNTSLKQYVHVLCVPLYEEKL